MLRLRGVLLTILRLVGLRARLLSILAVYKRRFTLTVALEHWIGSIPHGTGPHEHPSACRPPHGLPSACTRRKLTERREVYATQKNWAVSFPPLERGPSVPVPQDLLSSCDRGSQQDHESAQHATRGARSAGSGAVGCTASLGLRTPHDILGPHHSAPGSRCTPPRDPGG